MTLTKATRQIWEFCLLHPGGRTLRQKGDCLKIEAGQEFPSSFLLDKGRLKWGHQNHTGACCWHSAYAHPLYSVGAEARIPRYYSFQQILLDRHGHSTVRTAGNSLCRC